MSVNTFKDELYALHIDKNLYAIVIKDRDTWRNKSLPPDANNFELQMDVVKNFWLVTEQEIKRKR